MEKLAIHHEEAVTKAQENQMSEDKAHAIAETFKHLSDPTRVQILGVLFHADLCVNDIAYLLSMTPSAISHQLRLLKQARLVKSVKEGKHRMYMLDDDHVKVLFAQAILHISERK